METGYEPYSEQNHTKKKVSFNPIPQVKTFVSNTSNDISSASDSQAVFSKTFKFFYSNISSLSDHAQNYLLRLPYDIKAMLLVEAHKDIQKVKSAFKDFATP